MSSNTKWWRLVCKAPEVEEATGLAMASGALGTEITSSDTFMAYIDRNPEDLKNALTILGVTISEVSEVPNVNYVQNCQDVWQPIKVGKIELLPILESKNFDNSNRENTIFILPGNGFGTGHHQSTRLALSLLQEEPVTVQKPKKVLDLGTGNGVLGLGAILLYESKVDAIDTDPLAIENAAENLDLNKQMAVNINLVVGDVSAASTNYDLILANIYASTLIALESEIYSRVRVNGMVILAGIMTHEAPMIEESFCKPKWVLRKQVSEDNWCAFLITKA